MNIGKRQETFTLLLAKLIIKIYDMGYQVRMGEVLAKRRTPLEHKEYSLHYIKCAADLNLFKDGVFLEWTGDHQVFGDYWETLHPNCRWGGRYNDGNHYEILDRPINPEKSA